MFLMIHEKQMNFNGKSGKSLWSAYMVFVTNVHKITGIACFNNAGNIRGYFLYLPEYKDVGKANPPVSRTLHQIT